MKTCLWDPIDDFQTRGEFERFVLWITGEIARGEAQEVPVAKPYLGASSFTEKWYRHVGSRTVWRLVWPDGPFTGIFERVK